MEGVIEALDKGNVQMPHPGYFGLFNPAPRFALEWADRIASAFNPQIGVYSHVTVAVEVKQHVIKEIARRADPDETYDMRFHVGAASGGVLIAGDESRGALWLRLATNPLQKTSDCFKNLLIQREPSLTAPEGLHR